jgi:hypothetical protein
MKKKSKTNRYIKDVFCNHQSLKMDWFIDQLVDGTILGDYGNGEEIKNFLTTLYPFINFF